MRLEKGTLAIILPGFLFGFLIWAVIFLGDAYVSSTGRVDLRAGTFSFALFVWAPVLLALCGGISEIVRIRQKSGAWDPWRPYLSGLVAGGAAVFLVAAESGFRQYVPFLEPGLIPRLGFVSGRVIMYVFNPVSLLLIGLFALCSLCGGYLVFRMKGKIT